MYLGKPISAGNSLLWYILYCTWINGSSIVLGVRYSVYISYLLHTDINTFLKSVLAITDFFDKKPPLIFPFRTYGIFQLLLNKLFANLRVGGGFIHYNEDNLKKLGAVFT